MPRGKIADHDKLCPIVSPEEIEICTSCDLPAKACNKIKCDRFNRMMKALREKKKCKGNS